MRLTNRFSALPPATHTECLRDGLLSLSVAHLLGDFPHRAEGEEGRTGRQRQTERDEVPKRRPSQPGQASSLAVCVSEIVTFSSHPARLIFVDCTPTKDPLELGSIHVPIPSLWGRLAQARSPSLPFFCSHGKWLMGARLGGELMGPRAGNQMGGGLSF